MYLIYCHTNRINGMRYVGLTSRTMEQRWGGHVYAANHGIEGLFQVAIREHGVDAFDHDVICDGVQTLRDAKLLERHYIEMLGTWGPGGYNMTRGGNGRGPLTEDGRRRIGEGQSNRVQSLDERRRKSFALKGKPLSRNRCRKISESLTGKKLTDVTRQKISFSVRSQMTQERRAEMSRRATGRRFTMGADGRENCRVGALRRYGNKNWIERYAAYVAEHNVSFTTARRRVKAFASSAEAET